MIRSILGLFVGLLCGVVVVAIAEGLGHLIFPPPPGIDVTKPDQLATIMDQIPLGAKIAVIVAWALGIFAGGAVAILVARRQSWPAWGVAAVLFGFSVYTMMIIPHPIWMMVSAVGVTLAGAFAAVRLFARQPVGAVT